jgi:hypothetical protein
MLLDAAAGIGRKFQFQVFGEDREDFLAIS